MKRTLLLHGFIAIATLVIGMAGCKGSSTSDPYSTAPPPVTTPPAKTFVLSNYTFTPTTMTVARGTVVTWHNADYVAHTSTSDTPGLWDTGNIAAGSSKTITFNTAGTFGFHCFYHGSMGMTGTITVQ